jgi:hypothetical protein
MEKGGINIYGNALRNVKSGREEEDNIREKTDIRLRMSLSSDKRKNSLASSAREIIAFFLLAFLIFY